MSRPTRVFVNADVRPMDLADSRAEAIAWRGNRLVAIGSREAVLSEAGVDAETWDAAGATILPGFIDAHHHPSIAALYNGKPRLAPPTVTDIASLQASLATAASGLDEGEWLVAMDWDEMLLAERRPPTRAELDAAVPNHPLFALHYTCHRAVANSRALELAGIGRASADPSGGLISRGAGGLPDGLLIERGMSRVEALARGSLVARDAEGFFARLGAHHRALAASGITRIVDATVPGDLATLYREAERRGLLLVPTIVFPVSTSGYLEEPWEVLDRGPVARDDDGMLTVGPVKLVFDGAPVCAMCLGVWQTAGAAIRALAVSLQRGSLDAIRATASVKPRLGADGKVRTGVTIYQRADANKVVRAAVDRGFSIAIHAIGNEAVDVALSAYEAAGPALTRAGVPRIEHAAFLDRDLIARIRDSGVAVVTQPPMIKIPAVASAPPIPGLRYLPVRWLLDAGVTVAGSSDYPVVGFDPLDGIRSAIDRKTVRGDVHEPDQRIDLRAALTMYTRSAAAASGCLPWCGTLEVGKRADFVVLNGRLAEGAALANARVRTTVIGGELAFGALATDPPSA